ncbi:cwf18 pre-mRNA splicing factor-domain-containing protein [Suillus bovinus]|uniref:cwf18 pre-mRNA splicing factor-domain-containing protein n=1 Tax=Suillus bovinus TaxID=48563 RepID=UPI001B879044|nr:cwf18 pre-mRNA splicing factor-domain-containing protein [Suillus bovinus]KAG2158495.1 cwf18 pre-mRNA splicing factor-domain-containing protein [Suillus bovinus]
MSLQEASDARKARLIALRNRKEGISIVSNGDSVLLSRNYDPETRTLKKHSKNEVLTTDTIEKDVEGVAERIIAEDERQRAQELDVFNIAPKRPNWDLKREMDKKLAKLERKTQEAVHTLIRQRLASQKGQSDDILGAMNAQEKALDVEDQPSDEDE